MRQAVVIMTINDKRAQKCSKGDTRGNGFGFMDASTIDAAIRRWFSASVKRGASAGGMAAHVTQ